MEGGALRWSLVVGCLVAASLAGCMAPQPGSEALEPAEAPPAAAGDGAAGTADAPASASAEAAADAAPPATVETALSYAGRTPLGACAFAAVAGTCQYPVSGENSFMELAFPGQGQRLAGTVTVTTPGPGMVRAFLMHQDGEAWVWNSEDDPFTEGASPLGLDWDLSKYDTPLALSVSSMEFTGAVAVFAGAGTPAEFTVEGTITSVAAQA